jgi:MFE-2 hydratase 2 N-terminal domain
MAIVYDKLIALNIPEVEHSYTEKDAILYALGLGLGQDPTRADELAFVYEKNLKVLPTFAVMLAYPGFWARDLDSGIDWVKLVHGEQALTIHRPLAPRGTVTGKTRVVDIVDKGAGKGAR